MKENELTVFVLKGRFAFNIFLSLVVGVLGAIFPNVFSLAQWLCMALIAINSLGAFYYELKQIEELLK